MCWPHSQLSSFLMIVFGTTVPLHTNTVVVPSPSSFVLFIGVFSFHTYVLQRASTSLLDVALKRSCFTKDFHTDLHCTALLYRTIFYSSVLCAANSRCDPLLDCFIRKCDLQF
jgi:hypothetical protein